MLFLSLPDKLYHIEEEPPLNQTRLTYLIALCYLMVTASATAEYQLDAIVWERPQLTLSFQGESADPQLFQIAASRQLVIDLPKTVNRAQPPTLTPGPLEQITIAESGSTTRILLQLDELLPYQLQRQPGRIALSLLPPAADPSHRLDLMLESEPLTTTLRNIASRAGQNLILNGEISGTASLQLRQTHWRDAFDLLVAQHQLQLTEENGILVVSPPAVAPATVGTEPAEPAAPPMITEIIPLHYADAADLKQTLESSQKNPLLSQQGVLGIDERTNSLLVQESEQRLTQIRALIRQLDIPSRQVLIESRIVIAANEFSNELGARLGITHLQSAQQQWGFSLSGSADAANSALSGTTPGVTGSDSRLAVNLPATIATGRIGLTLAKLASGSLIDLELSAAQIEGKIIANPRIITANGYEAMIQQGVQIPYRSDTLSGGTDVSFKDAVMELKVTPQITPDDQIILTLQVKKDAVGAILCNNCEPSVDTREVKTRVMIGDGETLVIGGIYEERKTDSENRVPLLSELPLIGRLFQSQRQSDGRGELLIFITPSILQQRTG
jgi:type IV pilus assembly protein PilQ